MSGDRFIRLESHDQRKKKGDWYNADAWRDKQLGGEVRYFVVGVDPNKDADHSTHETCKP